LLPFTISIELNIKEAHIKFCEESSIDLQPLAIVRLTLNGRVSNWTKNLHVKAKIELEATYYNDKISNWEPLVEPVMVREDVYRPWSISLWFAIEEGGILQPPINDKGLQFIEFPVRDLDYSVLDKKTAAESGVVEDVGRIEVDLKYADLAQVQQAERVQSSIIDVASISSQEEEDEETTKEEEATPSSASYINIESNDLLNLNVTPSAYKVIMYLAQITAGSDEKEILENKAKRPFKFLNFLGESATLVVLPVSILRPEYVIGFNFEVNADSSNCRRQFEQDAESLYHSTESMSQTSHINLQDAQLNMLDTVRSQVDTIYDEKYKFSIHIKGFEEVKLSLKTDGAYLIQLRERPDKGGDRQIDKTRSRKPIDMIKYNIMFRIRTNYGRAKVIFR